MDLPRGRDECYNSTSVVLYLPDLAYLRYSVERIARRRRRRRRRQGLAASAPRISPVERTPARDKYPCWVIVGRERDLSMKTFMTQRYSDDGIVRLKQRLDFSRADDTGQRKTTESLSERDGRLAPNEANT